MRLAGDMAEGMRPASSPSVGILGAWPPAGDLFSGSAGIIHEAEPDARERRIG
jgi:hypothetical protein